MVHLMTRRCHFFSVYNFQKLKLRVWRSLLLIVGLTFWHLLWSWYNSGLVESATPPHLDYLYRAPRPESELFVNLAATLCTKTMFKAKFSRFSRLSISILTASWMASFVCRITNFGNRNLLWPSRPWDLSFSESVQRGLSIFAAHLHWTRFF